MSAAGAPALSSAAVVIPTYNERENLPRLIDVLRALDPGLLIVVVDDGSPDGTGESARALAARDPRLKVLRRPAKLGRGTAVLAGLREALEDPAVRCVLEMDADFSHDPAELPGIVDALAGAEVVIRSRYLPGSRIVLWGLTRRVLSLGANLFLRSLLGLRLTDLTNGYRGYSRRAAEAVDRAGLHCAGFVVLSEIAYLLHRRGFAFAELPSLFVNRRRGESNLGLRELLGALFGALTIRFKAR